MDLKIIRFLCRYFSIWSGATSVQVGLGVSLSSVTQNFNPGGYNTTGNALDLSIANNGFFIMKDSTSGKLAIPEKVNLKSIIMVISLLATAACKDSLL